MKSTAFTQLTHWFLATYPQRFPQPMKIKPEQLERLANSLLASYRAKELFSPKATEAELKATIAAIIKDKFAEEEARKMLASYAQVAKDMDPYKMFLLAKQKLAAKKGFIL
jgi:hypothetical protein